MLRHETSVKKPVMLPLQERRACARITSYVIVQCAVVFAGCWTIYYCVWTPEYSTEDYDKLARIMYLYDSDACGYQIHSILAISNLRLGNDSRGHDVLPIRWQPAIITVTARFSAATRWYFLIFTGDVRRFLGVVAGVRTGPPYAGRYLNFSVAVHVLWLLAAALLKVVVANGLGEGPLKCALSLFFYVSICVVIFDISMAIVYASHIKKSLTKGMILRYSGWSVEMKLRNYSDFGGWIPICAAVCWMRGIVLMLLNVYCCRAVHVMMRGLRKQEVRRRLTLTENRPLPEAEFRSPSDDSVLYYRSGEYVPCAGAAAGY